MRSHELAKAMLKAPDGEVVCSVDISTCEEDADYGKYECPNSHREGFWA